MSDLIKRMLGITGRDPLPENARDIQDIQEMKPGSETTGLYDAVLSGWFQNDTDELFRGMPIRREDVVVDVGCGEGGIVAFCARRGAHVIAIDVHRETLDKAREKLSRTIARKLDFHCCGAEKLPLEDETATRILCTEVLEHVEDPETVVRELVRVGQPDALYLFSVPGELNEKLMGQVGPESYFRRPNHIRIFKHGQFVQLIEDAGLEILEQQMVGFFWSMWWAFFLGTPNTAGEHSNVLDQWTKTWDALIETDEGRAMKHKLDAFMPKSHVIVARKPPLPGADPDSKAV